MFVVMVGETLFILSYVTQISKAPITQQSLRRYGWKMNDFDLFRKTIYNSLLFSFISLSGF